MLIANGLIIVKVRAPANILSHDFSIDVQLELNKLDKSQISNVKVMKIEIEFVRKLVQYIS